jgi:lysozyme family protein
MDAKTTAKFLQTQLNRYVKVTGLAPLTVDGAIGPATATATKMALNEIIKLASQNASGAQAWKDYHGFAWSYINTVDANNPATVTAQAYALADLFQKFGNFAGPPILPDAGTPSTATSVATTAKPPVASTALPAPSPVPTVATAASTVNFLGLKLPRIVLYAGGGALALAVVALIATRKPKTSLVAPP